jgi:hypothetical protein
VKTNFPLTPSLNAGFRLKVDGEMADAVLESEVRNRVALRRAGGSSGTESLAHEALCRGGTAATKTDAIDALGTAQFAATKRPPAAQLPDSATEELRELGKPSNPSNL